MKLRPNPHLYEINTWVWLTELSQQSGHTITLANVPDTEWDALAKRGFDLVWLMGVWQRSIPARHIARSDADLFREYDAALPGWSLDHVVGSPYGVRDYAPDLRMGTWDDLATVRRKLNERGIGLILDFVSNHTALDHRWTLSHPEYYVRGTLQDFRRDMAAFFLAEHDDGTCDVLACGRDPYFPPWRDTAQINFFEPNARRALVRQLKKIGSCCDGLRCDMAMLLLNEIFEKVWGARVGANKRPGTEFWAEARAAIPDTILIAEAYWGTEQRLLDLGFSFCYDKALYDALRAGDANSVSASFSSDFQHQTRLVRFLENHDEQRSATVFGTRIEAIGTLAATAPGMRFYHQGQFEGKKIHLPIQFGVPISEKPDPTAKAFYDRILALTNDDAFHSGKWRHASSAEAGDATSAHIIAYEWRTEQSWKLIAANVSDAVSEARIVVADEKWPAGNYLFFDALHDVTYQRAATELRERGLYVRLDPWRAHLFDIRAS